MEIGQLGVDYKALITVIPPPIHSELKDERCWGKAGSYTDKEGYIVVDVECNSYNKDMKWSKIWNKDGLPKINVFFWILAHRKTLTAANLRKREIRHAEMHSLQGI